MGKWLVMISAWESALHDGHRSLAALRLHTSPRGGQGDLSTEILQGTLCLHQSCDGGDSMGALAADGVTSAQVPYEVLHSFNPFSAHRHGSDYAPSPHTSVVAAPLS